MSRTATRIPDDAHSSGETLIAPQYTTELSDRAICHRNVHFAGADYIFISTRLMQDKFALAFELFINIGHHFVDAAGVPASFGELVDRQAHGAGARRDQPRCMGEPGARLRRAAHRSR